MSVEHFNGTGVDMLSFKWACLLELGVDPKSKKPPHLLSGKRAWYGFVSRSSAKELMFHCQDLKLDFARWIDEAFPPNSRCGQWLVFMLVFFSSFDLQAHVLRPAV